MTTQINPPEENFSFQLENYAIEHQGQAVIDLTVDWDLKEGIGKDNPLEYPDFTPIRDFISDFLVNYPNETDFWEILNKNLASALLTESIPTPFGVEYNLDEVLDAITIDIDIQPGSSGIDTPRSSKIIQTVERSEALSDKPLPKTVFGNSEAECFDTEIPGEIQFLGESGSDQFWLVTDTLDLPEKKNTITDFVKNEDVIGFANTTLGFDDLNLTQDGSDTVINALGQDLAILFDIQVNDLSLSDFAFV